MTAAASLHPPRPMLARCLPFAFYIAFLALQPWAPQGSSAFDARWLYALQITLVSGTLLLFRRDYGELLTFRCVRTADWGLSVLLGCAVFVLWINLDSGWVTLGATHAGFVPTTPSGGLDWPLVAVRILGAAVVVPLMEELFWRSFVQRWLDRQDFLLLQPTAVSLRSLLMASLAFGFEHGQWLAGIAAGLAYGFLYRRSGNLWSPIVAHGLTNLLLGVWVVSTRQWHFW